MSEARKNLLVHLAQTSEAPIGLEVDRAEGSWLYCADGRRYLDLIAGNRGFRSGPQAIRRCSAIHGRPAATCM